MKKVESNFGKNQKYLLRFLQTFAQEEMQKTFHSNNNSNG